MGAEQAATLEKMQQPHTLVKDVADVSLTIVSGDQKQQEPKPDPAPSVDTAGSAAEMFNTPGNKPQKRAWDVLKQHPELLIAPFLAFLVLVALSVFGVLQSTKHEQDNERDKALAAARETADSFVLQLSRMYGAALTMATHILRSPDWTQLDRIFPAASKEIFRQADEILPQSLTELHLVPFGKSGALYPPIRNLSTDLFSVTSLRPIAIRSVELRSMVVLGPQALTVGGKLAVLCRYPIFIPDVDENETFNNPFNMTHPTNWCPSGLCYDPATRTKFWGFTVAVVYVEKLLSGNLTRLTWLHNQGYNYRMWRSDVRANDSGVDVTLVTQSVRPPPPMLEDCVVVNMNMPGANWQLAVYKDGGWAPSWRDPLIGMVCTVSFILAGLLLLLLVSNKKANMLLNDQLISNRALAETNTKLAETKRVLEEEKLQRDTLLARQYDLIACFAQGKGGDTGGSSGSGEAATLERIAAVRRQLAERPGGVLGSSKAGEDDIRTQDLLGEGTFGKVYKGLWRGTVVAVKTMVLPANMSGQEKREKMAIMEAAISSSLAHPNIVQTYTYSIKPVRDSEAELLGNAMVVSDVHSVAKTAFAVSSGGPPSSTRDTSALEQGGTNIHSYEVRLVCEYCDRGCLRDALELGAFLSETGLNYAAILDCAMDIAKAMLHLHCNNVLHADLKARNVMLSSAGSEGRGVRCKVADFGLAVRMDHTETHMSGMFQGTFTHMAPEILLDGRMSKAADVYAFGITLWELFTSGQPFQGVPRALLGHTITRENKRPAFPLVVPAGYKALTERCWDPSPDKRPSFEEILDVLGKLREELPTETPALSAYVVPTPSQRQLPKLQMGGTTNGSGLAIGEGVRSAILTAKGPAGTLGLGNGNSNSLGEARSSNSGGLSAIQVNGGSGSGGRLAMVVGRGSGSGRGRSSMGGGKSVSFQLPCPAPLPAGIIVGDGTGIMDCLGSMGGGGHMDIGGSSLPGLNISSSVIAMSKSVAAALPSIGEEKEDYKDSKEVSS